MRTLRARPLLVLVLLAVVGLASCGSDDEPVGTGPGPGESGGIDGEWVATAITEDDAPRPLVDGTELRLRAADGELSFSAGCNTMSGTYELVDDVLTVDQLGGTEMGCDQALHDQDRWLSELLSSGPTVERSVDTFVVRAGTVEIVFTDLDVVEPDVELVGPEWVATTFVSGTGPDGAASDTGGLDVRVTFAEDGTASGTDGCNRFGGLAYEVDGDAIEFGDAHTSTMKGCQALAEPFWTVFRDTATWSIDGPVLTVTGSDSAVVFRTG